MKKLDRFSFFILGCAGIIIAIALMVMCGWVLHNVAMVEMIISYAPMQFNTAICFLICGLAIIALHLRARPTAFALACVVFCLASATLLQYALHINLNIDTVFITPFITLNVTYVGRMAPNTAVGFVLSSSAIALCTHVNAGSSRRAFIAALVGSLVLAIGAVPLLGYICGIIAAYSWGNYVHMALHTAICFILLGISIICYAWRSSYNWEQWIPIPVFIGLAAVAIATSGALRSQQDIEFSEQLQIEANHISLEAESRLGELYQALMRISDRWDAGGGTPKSLWESDASAYLRGYPFLAALSRTDPDTKIIWLEPLTPNNKAMGFYLSSEPKRAEAASRAIATHQPQATSAIDLLGGGKGFLNVLPLYSHKQFDGLLVAVFRIDTFFSSLLSKGDFHNYYVTVEDTGRLYSNLPVGQDHLWPWVEHAEFKNLDTTWTITVSPKPQTLQDKTSVLPTVLLVIGLLTSGLVTLCVILTLKWWQNNQILRQREHVLAELNSINTAILSSATHMIIATDLHGTVIVFNVQAERTLGYSAADVIGKQTPALWHDRDEIKKRAEELSLEAGQTIEPGFDVFTYNPRLHGSEHREWSFIRRDSTRFPGDLTASALRDEAGNVVGYLGIIQDVTERRRQEEALKTSEETFRLAMENASIGMALVSPTGGFLKVNKAMCDIVGYSHEEMRKLDFQTITHPDDLNADLAYFYQMLSGEINHYNMEKRYLHKNGAVVMIMLNVSVVRKPSGTPAYFIAHVQDITERKRAELELKASEAFNRSLMEASADCIMVLDVNGRLLQMNIPGQHLMDIEDFNAISGKAWETLWPKENQNEVRNAVKIAADGGEYRFQAFCPTRKGEARWWDVQVSPVPDPDGHVVHLLCGARDITQSKEIERMKTEFISTVSHELRTPLTSIRGSLGLITGGIAGKLEPKVAELLQIAHKNSERLVRLINNILDIEKIESGSMSFEMRPLAIDALLQHALDETQGYANNYGVTLALQNQSPGAHVMGDYDRLLQVMNNLLSNAIKYSPPQGQVTVSCARKNGKIHIEVQDKGLGIPEAFKLRIFGKFAQADSSDTRQKGGTGLGLSITRAIIESMEGTIDFESVPGNTVFYFVLPEHLVQRSPVAEELPEAATKILICEDDPDIASLLEMVLKKEGFGCDITGTAASAKAMLEQGNYAAMTLDLGLPDQDGIALIRELRSQSKTSLLPIIVISGHAEQGKKTLGSGAIGILDWLPKPIDIERIRAILKSIPISASLPSILHVEDDMDIVEIISTSLKDEAHLIAALSLSEAYTLLSQKAFDLAILDLNLPDGSGLDLLPDLSAKSLPVIILSMEETSHEIQQRVSASLVKSVISEDKIIKTIRSLLPKKKGPL